MNRNALFRDGLQPHNYCLPILKREVHSNFDEWFLKAISSFLFYQLTSITLRHLLKSAVTSGSKQFFLGTDSAPHEKHTKEAPCGCAGIFNAPVALSVYARAFEEARITQLFRIHLCTYMKYFRFPFYIECIKSSIWYPKQENPNAR